MARLASVLAALALLCVGSVPATSAPAETREQRVRGDRERVEAEGFWIYNDLDRGFAEARRTGKPLLVVLRCLPCVECVKLDDDLIDQHPVVRPLLERFVCVRQVSTNGLDLATFQFDTDQSFAVFMLNGDGTIYGRFGTRSHRTEWLGDVSIKGLAAALEGALELHAAYPSNRAALAAKRGPAPLVASPELFPSLAGKYTDALNYEGNVVQSCIHCHQIGDATRDFYRARRQPIPEQVLYPYPHPKSLGLVLDPNERATVRDVLPGSLAAESGLAAGDRIVRLAGQPLLSMADVQWVLHQADPAGAQITATVEREGTSRDVTLALPAGWRRAGDLTWRSSSWGLRRMTTGGLTLIDTPADVRRRARLADDAMALTVKAVGMYGAHAAAKKAGFQVGDVIVAFDGRTDLFSEADLFRHATRECPAGVEVAVRVLRGDRTLTLRLPMQQ